MELRELHRSLMIVKPSIAFNDFAGTAKDVTARNVKGRNILSSRAQHSKIVTPAQAVSRNRLSKISRTFRQLSDSQINQWEVLAGHLKGISTFGQAASLTAHNAFVRINSNRAMVGMPPLEDAPIYKADVPEVIYEDLWIAPDMIVFTGLEVPSDTYRLVVKMSPAQSPGTSSGWSKTVIVAPGIIDDWGEANITKLFTETIGVAPQEGLKYYLECWWLDTETGFTGESMWVSAICKETSVGYDAPYVPRTIIEIDEAYDDFTRCYLGDMEVGLVKGSALANGKFIYEWRNTRVNMYVEDVTLPPAIFPCDMVFMGRGTKLDPRSINLISMSVEKYSEGTRLHINVPSCRTEHYYEVFDTTAVTE